MKKQLAVVMKCSGDCRNCENLDFHSASTGPATYFAFGCKQVDTLSAISERPSKMHEEIINTLKFELNMV